MKDNEKEIKKVGPIVETAWGILLLVSSVTLFIIGCLAMFLNWLS